MSMRYFERAWNIMDEIEEMDRRHEQTIVELKQSMDEIQYSIPSLRQSTQKLEYSKDLEKFVEEKLGVTREGECTEKINAMPTQQFIEFYKEVMDEWDDRQRTYDDYDEMTY